MSSDRAHPDPDWLSRLYARALRQARCDSWRAHEKINPEANVRVAVVCPHADDELAGCAGTIARHVAAGCDVTLIYVSDGRGWPGYGENPERAERRRVEASRAAAVLGARDPVWMGLREGAWDIADAAAALAAHIERLAPQILYAPSVVDFHPEHVRVAKSLAGALSIAELAPLVRVYQVMVPLTPVLVNRVVDTTHVRSVLTQLRSVYERESASIARFERSSRYESALWMRGRGSAEVFWEMGASDYVRTQQITSTSSRYHGLRHRSFSDPLTFAVGLRERFRLLRAVGRESPSPASSVDV